MGRFRPNINKLLDLLITDFNHQRSNLDIDPHKDPIDVRILSHETKDIIVMLGDFPPATDTDLYGVR